MIAAPTEELLHRLRNGTFHAEDTTMLEQTSATQLVNELKSVYRLTFQERRLRNKWEVSLARVLRPELVRRPIPDSVFASFLLIPVYRGCLMLSIEDDTITGISTLNRLAVWSISKPTPGLALKSGHGFKLDKGPDGWDLKPMGRKKVRLAESFLRNRGWRFDHLDLLVPTS